MATNGTAIAFGFATAEGVSGTGLTGNILLQNADLEYTSDEEQARDATGALVTRHFYNPGKKATLEYLAKGSSLATARSNTVVTTPGSIITIEAATDITGLNSTYWIVVAGPKISKTNTGAARITLPLEAFAGVTVAAS